MTYKDNDEVVAYTFSSKEKSIIIPYDAEDGKITQAISEIIDTYNFTIHKTFTKD